MSEPKEIKLSIFEPLNEYFQLLCLACPTADFVTGCNGNKDLMKLLTNECDSKGKTDKPYEISENFLQALEQFAVNLKTADKPLSKITIKGTLYKDFIAAFEEYKSKFPDTKTKSINDITLGELTGYDVNEIAKIIENKVNNDAECKKVKFSLSNKISLNPDVPTTYLDKLKVFLDISGVDVNAKLMEFVKERFNGWLTESFDTIYGSSNKYFTNVFLKEIYECGSFPNCYVNPCQKKLMENYFEIIGSGNNIVNWKSFWGNADSSDWGTLLKNKSPGGPSPYVNYRLNVIVVNRYAKVDGSKTSYPLAKTLKDKSRTEFDENIAKIAFAFPDNVRNDFNKLLISGNPGFTSSYSSKSYSYAGTKCSTYKIPDLKNTLDFFSREILNASRGKRIEDKWVPDVPDVEPYSDSDADQTPYLIEELDSYIVNYKDTWAADLSGRLWKRTKEKDGSFSKWTEYTDSDLESDVKLVREGADETCGHLCIFDDSSKCNKFFEDMMKGFSYSMDQLAVEINSAKFVRSYQKLKDNIVNVNPVFVIGTLRMFQFQKYTKLNDDGTKTIKIESFTRWWNRVGKELKLDVKGDDVYTKGMPLDKFPGVHKQDGLLPNPPANLELFFKLLISYINNNEYVLNPQSKELVNRLPFTTVDRNLSEPQPEFFILNGEQVRNPAYDKETDENSVESLGNLMEEMKKNSSPWNPVDMGSYENRSNLVTLLGMMVGVTQGGNIRLGKAHPFSTGYGYSSFAGGSGSVDFSNFIDADSSEQAKVLKALKPCSQSALKTFLDGVKSLEEHGKKLDVNNKYYIDLVRGLNELANSENQVYADLKLLADYVFVIGHLKEKTIDDKVVAETMNDAVEEYKRSSNILAHKADSASSLLMNVFDKSLGSSSYYSKLGGR